MYFLSKFFSSKAKFTKGDIKQKVKITKYDEYVYQVNG